MQSVRGEGKEYDLKLKFWNQSAELLGASILGFNIGSPIGVLTFVQPINNVVSYLQWPET